MIVDVCISKEDAESLGLITLCRNCEQPIYSKITEGDVYVHTSNNHHYCATAIKNKPMNAYPRLDIKQRIMQKNLANLIASHYIKEK